MLKDKLKSIKEAILKYNKYFNDGFDDVYADEKGIRNGQQAIFPADKLGDYFYIRLNNGIKMQRESPVMDCAIGTGLTMTGYIIACVRGANADQLIENITNTLIFNATLPTGANWNKEEVIRQEMKGMKSADITAALARVDKDYTIVSVSFEYKGSIYPVKLNCMLNPCACS